MRSLGTLCYDLRLLDGVVGAFVFDHDHCVASSLPPQYDINRLARVGATLKQMQQIAGATGYGGDFLALHWEDALLLAWGAGEGTLLGLLATPDSARDTVEANAARVLAAMEDLLPQRQFEQEAPTRPNNLAPR